MNECNIIRDVLPLYAESMVSEDTKAFVEGHLKGCDECRKELEMINKPEIIQTACDAVPLAGIRKKLVMKRIQTVVLSVIMVLAIAVVAFSYITKPIHFEYTDDLITVTETGDGGVLLTFREDVAACSYESMPSPENGEGKYYFVEAWTSRLLQWTNEDTENKTLTAYPTVGMPQMTIYYTQNNGEEDVCIYGEPITNGGVITQPRLALNYYLFTALVLFAVLGVLWLVFRKKARVKIGLERAILFPLSYILSHIAICGLSGVSYTMTRDFELILLVTLLLYCVLLLVYNVIRIRKEIKEYI
ncbi:MAG: zf-HC2 domain-containing protein [Oscillospiraceae bacterium]|nr:zf-HC2 domain-containing protein [Oscillospiraceae bacterium]